MHASASAIGLLVRSIMNPMPEQGIGSIGSIGGVGDTREPVDANLAPEVGHAARTSVVFPEQCHYGIKK